MEVDRRTVLAGGAALLATAPTLVRAKPAAGPGWYDRAIIIDALGGTSDPMAPRIGCDGATEPGPKPSGPA